MPPKRKSSKMKAGRMTIPPVPEGFASWDSWFNSIKSPADVERLPRNLQSAYESMRRERGIAEWQRTDPGFLARQAEVNAQLEDMAMERRANAVRKINEQKEKDIPQAFKWFTDATDIAAQAMKKLPIVGKVVEGIEQARDAVVGAIDGNERNKQLRYIIEGSGMSPRQLAEFNSLMAKVPEKHRAAAMKHLESHMMRGGGKQSKTNWKAVTSDDIKGLGEDWFTTQATSMPPHWFIKKHNLYFPAWMREWKKAQLRGDPNADELWKWPSGGAHPRPCGGSLSGAGILDTLKDWISSFFKSSSKPAAPPSAPSDPLAEARAMLESVGIRSRKDFNKWAVKNHPDKGGDTGNFQRVSNYVDKVYKGGKRKSIPMQHYTT